MKEKSSTIKVHDNTEGLLIPHLAQAHCGMKMELGDRLQHLAQAKLVANDILPSTAQSNPRMRPDKVKRGLPHSAQAHDNDMNRIADVLPHLT